MVRYIRFLEKVLYCWDIIITALDNFNVRTYLKLKLYINDLKYARKDEKLPPIDTELEEFFDHNPMKSLKRRN